MDHWPVFWLPIFVSTVENRTRRNMVYSSTLQHMTLQSAVWGGTAGTLFKNEINKLKALDA